MANFLERIQDLLTVGGRRGAEGQAPATAKTLLAHLERVLKWGKSMNLTGAKEIKELIEEHLADALPFAFLLPSGARLLDVGSGAGFPGMIVAIVRPDIKVTLLESNHKKAVFLRTAAREANLSNVVALDGDIFAPPSDVTPPFSAVVSRAVFAPDRWVGIGAPLVAPGGLLYALLANDPPPLAPEGFSILQTHSYKLASGAKRTIAIYQAGNGEWGIGNGEKTGAREKIEGKGGLTSGPIPHSPSPIPSSAIPHSPFPIPPGGRWRSLEEELDALRNEGLWRFERSLDHANNHPEVVLDGRPVVDFSSNHYLGLGREPSVIRALQEGATSFGAGGLASRLIGGTMPPHLLLEREISRFKETEDAVLFGSGFLANAGAIPALVGPEDAVFSDSLNHASLIDGCRLSRAKVFVYPHRDHRALASLLEAHAKEARRRLIVTDSIFSMDGDEAPLEELSGLAHQYDAFLYLDEAHATGVYGPDGKGLAASLGIVPDIAMGTLSKALGCVGAFIAGPKVLCDLLRNRARSYVFTTSMPPAMAAAAIESLRLCQSAHPQRKKLWENNQHFRGGLRSLGIVVPEESKAPIIPIQIGAPDATMAASRRLLEQGIFAHGIRPPTVPTGTGRLRFTILSTHTHEHIEQALNALRRL